VKPRDPNIRVLVTQSVEPIDFDLWAQRYIDAVLAADRAAQAKQAAA
jgi:hypothetical protein